MLSWLQHNWLDLGVVVVLAWYAYSGYRRGCIALIFELVGFFVSLSGALLLYGHVTDFVTAHTQISRAFAKPIGFFAAWAVIELAYDRLADYLYAKIPHRFRIAKANRVLGVIPAIANGAVLVAVVLSVAVALPLPAVVKRDVLASRAGSTLINATDAFDRALSAVFGGAAKETLNFLTVHEGENESINLRFKTSDFSPDPVAEQHMLALVNGERTKRGLRALRMDAALVALARAHSADMLRRGYFSHVTPDGLSPADRAAAAGIDYLILGENIAYAPDVDIAHTGLMNSPPHRANILSREFSRVGIGIEDAGLYGIMVTQDFEN